MISFTATALWRWWHHDLKGSNVLLGVWKHVHKCVKMGIQGKADGTASASS